MADHELLAFIDQVSAEMAAEYQRIQKRVHEDPGTAGDQGEENWATLFRDWLPPTYQIVTKGRILGISGDASPQVDVLVLEPSYPHKLLDKKLYLAGGVAAAFECKLTLEAKHLDTAAKNAAEIRNLIPARSGTPYRELNSGLIYGVLAHSHSWKQPNSRPMENIREGLLKGYVKHAGHPRDMLDAVCVSDLGAWFPFKLPFMGPSLMRSSWSAVRDLYGYPNEGAAAAGYIIPNPLTDHAPPTPIGELLQRMLAKLAWENPAIRPLANYFSSLRMDTPGKAQLRHWTAGIYSDEVAARVVAGHLSNGIRWDEWSVAFG
jgi:hypothetical protein